MRIFYDMDTQHDFMNKDGALYVPEAELIKPNLKLITDFVRERYIPVVGSVDRHFGTPEYRHREGELKRWGGDFPDHCMDGTSGQMKIPETTLQKATSDRSLAYLGGRRDYGHYIENFLLTDYSREEAKKKLAELWPGEDFTKVIEDEFKKRTIGVSEVDIEETLYQLEQIKENKLKPWGIYFEKQSYDVFTNPNTEELLKRIEAKEAVVYGVATDYCVKDAVLGMQERGIQCYVVEDAIKGVDTKKTESALEEMAKAGAKFVKTKDVIGGKI